MTRWSTTGRRCRLTIGPWTAGSAAAVLFSLLAIGPAQANQIEWPLNPTPITLKDFTVAVTPEGRLISWSAAGEIKIRGYRVQARSGSAAPWQDVSAEIMVAQGGPEGSTYAWHHRDATAGLEYRLVEISNGGMLLPIDATDPDDKRERAARQAAKGHP